MSEFQVKLEAIREYQEALRYRKVNEELTDSLLGLLTQISRHYEKSGMPLPEEVSRLMERTSELLDARIESSKIPH